MNPEISSPRPLERLLAGVLHYGTGVASAVIALGLVVAMLAPHAGADTDLAVAPGMRIVATGIVLFILLPVLRVTLMLIVFLRERDYRFGAIAALVLVIIFLGFILGMRPHPRSEPGNSSPGSTARSHVR